MLVALHDNAHVFGADVMVKVGIGIDLADMAKAGVARNKRFLLVANDAFADAFHEPLGCGLPSVANDAADCDIFVHFEGGMDKSIAKFGADFLFIKIAEAMGEAVLLQKGNEFAASHGMFLIG